MKRSLVVTFQVCDNSCTVTLNQVVVKTQKRLKQKFPNSIQPVNNNYPFNYSSFNCKFCIGEEFISTFRGSFRRLFEIQEIFYRVLCQYFLWVPKHQVHYHKKCLCFQSIFRKQAMEIIIKKTYLLFKWYLFEFGSTSRFL